MYEKLKKLYREGRICLTGLSNALTKGWITQEQYDEIVFELATVNNNEENVEWVSTKS